MKNFVKNKTMKMYRYLRIVNLQGSKLFLGSVTSPVLVRFTLVNILLKIIYKHFPQMSTVFLFFLFIQRVARYLKEMLINSMHRQGIRSSHFKVKSVTKSHSKTVKVAVKIFLDFE